MYAITTTPNNVSYFLIFHWWHLKLTRLFMNQKIQWMFNPLFYEYIFSLVLQNKMHRFHAIYSIG